MAIAPVHVESFVRDTQLIAAIKDLHGKRFVELPEVDVGDLEARPREQFGHREHGSDTHFVGLAAGDGEPPENPQRLEPAPRRLRGAHHDAGSRAVRELARVARRDHATGIAGFIRATAS